MGKVNLYLKICLINKKMEYNIKGIVQDNIIKYYDQDAKMIVNMNNKTIERIKKDETIVLDFYNNICITKTKEFELSIPIKILKYERKDKELLINYQIEDNIFKYKIIILEEI